MPCLTKGHWNVNFYYNGAWNSGGITLIYSFAAIYLTIVMTICAINLLIQILLMPTPNGIPLAIQSRWLNTVKNCQTTRLVNSAKQPPQKHDEGRNRNYGSKVSSVDNFKGNEKCSPSKAKHGVTTDEEYSVSSSAKPHDEENTPIEEEKLIAERFCRFLFYLSIAVKFILNMVCFVILPAVKHEWLRKWLPCYDLAH